MSLFNVGRLVIKIAGRDAGKTGIVVNQIDDNYVLIDGHVRRKKCNIKHLEALPQILKIKKDASHEEVKTEFEKIGLKVIDSKPKEQKERPKKQKKQKEKLVKKNKVQEKKKETPKVEKKTETKKEEPKTKESDFEKTVEKETKKE